MNGIDTAVKVVSNVGFPIFVALYLLLRFERKLDDNTRSNDRLHEEIRNVMRWCMEQASKP